MNGSTASDPAISKPGALPAAAPALSSQPLAPAIPQPLLPVVLFYASGILAGWSAGGQPLLLLSALLCLAALALVWRRARGRLLLSGLLVAAGWTNYWLHTAILTSRDLRLQLGEQPQIVTLRGTLRETPAARFIESKHPWHSQAQLAVTALSAHPPDWQPVSGTVAVSTPDQLTNFFAGQTVEVTGVAARPAGPEAEGLFDYRTYLEHQGIYYHLQCQSQKDWRLVSSPARRPLADRFRDWCRRALALGLPAEDESLRLEWALTLGWKAALTEPVSECFVQAATYHIFAVDGLRMAIVFGIFFALLRALGLPRPAIGVLSWPALWFYVALTGWPASAIRAMVMLTIVTLGWVLKRPWNPLNSLLAAALVILAWEPQQIFQAGFQLSFFVVLYLILLLPPLHDLCQRLLAPDPLLPEQLYPRWRTQYRAPLRYGGELILTSFAAWIGSLPLVACYFNILTPVSTPANLVAVPLCSLVLICNLTSLLLAGWFTAAAELFNHSGWFLMECIRVSSHWFAALPGAYAYVPAPTLLTCGLYYGLLLGLLTGWIFRPAQRLVKISLLGMLFLAWTGQEWREFTTTRLTLIPTDGALAIYLDAPGRKNDLLIDCGNTNTVEAMLKPFLRAQGVNRLHQLVLTHGDIHHVGGAELVTMLFAIRTVDIGPARSRSPVYRRIVEDLRRPPDRLQQISRGQSLGAWNILHPQADDDFPRADDNAVVLLGSLGQGPLLLLSDLGRPGQNALLERTPDLRAEVVIAGLPAVGEPLCDALLDTIQPRLIIVADAEFPATEHASATLRRRLAEHGIPVLYTRSTGPITLEWRRTGWSLRSINGPRFTRDSIPSAQALAADSPPPLPAGD